MMISEIIERLKNRWNNDNEFSDFYEEFSNIRNDEERIRRIYQLLVYYQIMTDHLRVDENNNKAFARLKFSERLFKLKYFKGSHAWSCQALKCATRPELIYHIYDRRSHNSFCMGQYVDCLNDIDNAVNLMPSFSTAEMLKRADESKNFVSSPNFQEISISHFGNGCEREYMNSEWFCRPYLRMVKMPCACSSIQISNNCEVTAIEDIQPGKVLIMEDPYVSIVDENYQHNRCDYCCTINYAMMVCPACKELMYCNKDCWQKSWDEGHKFECPIKHALRRMKIKDSDILPLRILMKAKCEFKSLALILRTIDRLGIKTDPKMNGFHRNTKGELSHYGYRYFPIHFFKNTTEDMSPLQIITKSVIAACLIHLLRGYSAFFNEYSEKTGIEKELDDEEIWRIGGVLYRGLCTSELESLKIKRYSKIDMKTTKETEIGLGCFAFANFFEQSSDPNAGHIFRRNQISIIACKPIKKGEKINLYCEPNSSKNPFLDKRFEFFLMNLLRSNQSWM